MIVLKKSILLMHYPFLCITIVSHSCTYFFQYVFFRFRLRAIQISISHDQLNNRTISSNNDDQDLLGSSPPMTLGGQLATQPIMPIITQPRRPSIGRESFRQRNLGCVPQNLVFRGDSAAQIAPNLNIGK